MVDYRICQVYTLVAVNGHWHSIATNQLIHALLKGLQKPGGIGSPLLGLACHACPGIVVGVLCPAEVQS